METNKGIVKTQRNLHLGFLASAAFLVLTGASLQATVLLNDDFSDGSRTDQNLTSSSAWYSSGNASTLTVVSNALVSASGTTARQAVTYFTNSGVQTLGVGDSLSISFSMAETTFSSTSIFRMGLFNSGGTRVSADNTSNSNAAFTNYTGYSLFTSPTSNLPTGSTLRYRSVADPSLFGTTQNVALTGNNPTLNLTDSAPYNFTFTITNTSASTITINALVKDSSNTTTLMNFTATDSVNHFTGFDTFAFYGANGASTSATITLDNVLVTYTAAVPEPATCGLAILGVGFALWRVRRARA